MDLKTFLFAASIGVLVLAGGCNKSAPAQRHAAERAREESAHRVTTLPMTARTGSKTVIYHQFAVKRVVDGDTFIIDTSAYNFFPELEFSVRVYGIDTPEHGGKAHCSKEAALADQATAYGEQLLQQSGNSVTLSHVKNDKYGGRFDAVVTLQDGQEYGKLLIDKGLARPYFGAKKSSWCQ